MTFKGVTCKDYIWARFIAWINLRWSITAEKLWGSYDGLQTNHESRNSCCCKKKKKRLVLHWVAPVGVYPFSGMKQLCSGQYWLIHFKKDTDEPESPFEARGGWLERWPGSKDQMGLVQRKGWRKNPTENLKYVRNYKEKGNNLCVKAECKFRLAIRTTFLRCKGLQSTVIAYWKKSWHLHHSIP